MGAASDVINDSSFICICIGIVSIQTNRRNDNDCDPPSLVSLYYFVLPASRCLTAADSLSFLFVSLCSDLGDRISIVDVNCAPNNRDPGYSDTWFVEDVNLFTTTLRLSRTNELSTVNNGTVANSRIINHGRSIDALVTVSLPMRIEATHDQVQVVKDSIEQYIQDHPRIWSSLAFFMITKVDAPNRLVEYAAVLQHVKTWQDLLPVLAARGEISRFITEILMKLGIEYEGRITTNEISIKEFPNQHMLADTLKHHNG